MWQLMAELTLSSPNHSHFKVFHPPANIPLFPVPTHSIFHIMPSGYLEGQHPFENVLKPKAVNTLLYTLLLSLPLSVSVSVCLSLSHTHYCIYKFKGFAGAFKPMQKLVCGFWFKRPSFESFRGRRAPQRPSIKSTPLTLQTGRLSLEETLT